MQPHMLLSCDHLVPLALWLKVHSKKNVARKICLLEGERGIGRADCGTLSSWQFGKTIAGLMSTKVNPRDMEL